MHSQDFTSFGLAEVQIRVKHVEASVGNVPYKQRDTGATTLVHATLYIASSIRVPILHRCATPSVHQVTPNMEKRGEMIDYLRVQE